MCLNQVSVITDVFILLLKVISTSDVICVYIRESGLYCAFTLSGVCFEVYYESPGAVMYYVSLCGRPDAAIYQVCS